MMNNKLLKNKEDLYIIARWAYSLGKEIISDDDYAELDDYMKVKGLLSDYTNRTWSEDSCPVGLLKKYNMEYLIEEVVTFKDTESIPSITSWTDLELKFKNAKYPLRLSRKLDGFNFHLTYVDGTLYKGNTRARRGNGLEFRELNNFNIIQEIDTRGVYSIVGELTLSKTNFRTLRAMFPKLELTSQRASVRTALANTEAHHLLKFTAFTVQGIDNRYTEENLLKDWRFETPGYIWINSYEELLKKINDMSEAEVGKEDPSDGLVIEDADGKIQWAIRLGHWETSILKSYITGYEEESGMFNDVPKLVIRDILSESNSKHTLVPIVNWARIIDNRLEIGSPIAFKLTSKAAPVIDLETTKLLQEKYFGNYESYREMIDIEQESKNLNRIL